MMTNSDEGRHTAPGSRSSGAGWKGARGVAIAALVAAGLMLAPAIARAADQGTPSGPHAADPKHRVSPYARLAREHQQLVGRKSARGKHATLSVGHAPRAGGHTRR
jgi:hypothetical protein